MKKILLILMLIISITSCTNYSNLGLPRGFNGRIVTIYPGSTNRSFIMSMYGNPSNSEVFPDGSRNETWVLDTSAGPCSVIIGFTQYGIVNWYNYIYHKAVKYR